MKTNAKENARTPESVVADMAQLNQTAFESKLEICKLFAEGWTYYSDKVWSGEQVTDFLTRLYMSGFGPNPQNTILSEDNTNKEGQFKIGTNCATYYTMLKVGQSKLFDNAKVRSARAVSSISTLYRLVRFFDALLKKGSSEAVASKRVIALLERKGEITRETVNAEITKLRNKNEEKDLDKSETTFNFPTLDGYVDNGQTFDAILLTPNEEAFERFEEEPEPALDTNLSLDQVRKEETHLAMCVAGKQLVAALRWFDQAFQNREPYVYALAKSGFNGCNVNLSNKQVVVSSVPMKLGNEKDLEQRVRLAMKGKSKLAMYSDHVTADWNACDA